MAKFGYWKAGIGSLNDVDSEGLPSEHEVQRRLRQVNRTLGGFVRPPYNSSRVLLYIFLSVIAIFAVLWINQAIKASKLNRHGVEKEARVIGIHRANFLWNQMDITWINNYLIKYEFTVGGKKFQANEVVGIDKIQLYFNEEPKINGSVKCKYLPNSPKISRLVKVDDYEES